MMNDLPISQAFPGYTIDDLYNAFAFAETGEYVKMGLSPWRRTQGTSSQRVGKEKGSSAYGPVQMTRDLVKNTIKEGHDLKKLYTPEELQFINRFLEHSEKLFKYGALDQPKGGIDPNTGEDVSIYDYSDPLEQIMSPTKSFNSRKGLGSLKVEDRPLYESVAKKIIKYELTRNNGGIKELKRRWRDRSKGDTGYYKNFDKALKESIKARKEKEDKAFFFPDNIMPMDIPISVSYTHLTLPTKA